MASLLNVDSLTISPEEKKAVGEFIIEKALPATDIAENHELMTGIKYKTQIPFVGKMGIVGEKLTGTSCSVPTETAQLNLSQKIWDPVISGFRLTHCQDDLNHDFKLTKQTLKALGFWNVMEGNDPKLNLISASVLNSLKEMTFRLTWFGDTSADVVGSGGNLTAGTGTKYFTPLDGLFKQIETGVTATDIPYVEITQNSAGTKADQYNISASDAYNYLVSVWENADPRIFDIPNLRIYATRSIYDKYYQYAEQNQYGFSMEKLENGQNRLTFRGYPIVAQYEWDRLIKTYYDLGSTYYNPNRIVLSAPSNLPVGLIDSEGLTTLDSWYEKKDKINYIDAAVGIDTKVLEEELISVAY